MLRVLPRDVLKDVLLCEHRRVLTGILIGVLMGVLKVHYQAEKKTIVMEYFTLQSPTRRGAGGGERAETDREKDDNYSPLR